MIERLKTLAQLPGYGAVAYRLFRDDRVPVSSKVLLVVALLAIILALDMLDWIPGVRGVGQLALIVVVLRAFINAAPDEARDEHLLAVGLSGV